MRSRLLTAGIILTVIALGCVTGAVLLNAGQAGGDRAYALEQRLRCPVCKSVSIAESPAETAAAMRREVAEQVASGRTDQQIIDYFRARYTDWVLLDPPPRGNTLALWALPVAAALVGALLVITRARKRPAPRLEPSAHDLEQLSAALRRMRSAPLDQDEP